MKFLSDYLSIFPIGLGAMPLSIAGRPTEKEAIIIIETFIKSGGNFIDTADIYGLDDSDRGHNEKLIYKALKQLQYLDKVIVTTKGGGTRINSGWNILGGHPKKLRTACEKSLKNLGIEAHALYYLHGIDPYIPVEDSIGEIMNMKVEGKIQHIGVANVDLNEIKNIESMTKIVAVQNRCNPFSKRDFTNGVIEYCRINYINYIAYSPLGGWSDHKKLSTCELYRSISLKYEISSYSINLAWLLAKADHIIPIPGMDTKNYVLQNLNSVNISLDEADIQKIDLFPDLYSSKHI